MRSALRGPLLALVVSASIVGLSIAGARALGHPPVLDPEAGCERWLGGASGNDSSVRLNLLLCPDGSAVRGQIQWSSTVSGWNVREVTGRWEADVLSLSDVRFTEARPAPGWHFCKIERWSLTRRGERLEGHYDAPACNDHASVWLERMAEEPSQATGSAEPPHTVEHTAGSAEPPHAAEHTTESAESPSPPSNTVPHAQQTSASQTGGCGACDVARAGRDDSASDRRGTIMFALLSISIGVRLRRRGARPQS